MKNNAHYLGIENNYFEIYKKHIKRALSQTALQERDDLQQELSIKIFQKVKTLDFREEAPSFWGFFSEIEVNVCSSDCCKQ